MAQGLCVLSLVPVPGGAAAVVVAPRLLSLVLIVVIGQETLGKNLRELDGEVRFSSSVS